MKGYCLKTVGRKSRKDEGRQEGRMEAEGQEESKRERSQERKIIINHKGL